MAMAPELVAEGEQRLDISDGAKIRQHYDHVPNVSILV